MESEMVLEVPDTPDRVVFARSAAESPLHSCRLEDKPSSSNQYLEPANRSCSRQLRTASFHDVSGNNVVPVDSDFLFEQAKLAQCMSDTSESRTSHLHNSSAKPGGTFLNNGGTSADMIGLCQESPFNLSSPTRCRGLRLKSDKHRTRQNERNQSSECFLDVGSLIPAADIVKFCNNAGKPLKRFNGCSNMGGEKNVKVYSKGVLSNKEQVSVQLVDSGSNEEQLQLDSFHIGLQSNVQQRKPLSSGCTEPLPAANNSICSKGQAGENGHKRGNPVDQRACSSFVPRYQDNESWKELQSTTRQVSHGHQELGTHPRTGHRRLVRNGCISPSNVAQNKKDVKLKVIEEGSNTSCKLIDLSSPPSIQTTGSSSASNAADKGKGKALMNENLQTERNESNPRRRRPFLIPRKEITFSNMEYDAGMIGLHEQEWTAEEPSFTSGANLMRMKGCHDLEVAQHSGKRKVSSTLPSIDECSVSNIDIPIVRNEWAPGKSLHCHSTRNRRSLRNENMALVLEIDDLDNKNQLENHELSDESIARAIQLESDEVLARQLQEQFYLESPPVGDTEVDWQSLQEEGDHHFSIRRRNQSRMREDAIPVLSASPRFRHSSTRPVTRARLAYRLGHARRNTSRTNLSLEERLGFLEALDAAFEGGNGDDYEMLLALDENNHHHVGASASQINSLPQSVMQNAGSEEVCAVCLEIPSLGDTIRHLPCFHKFHKECIDTWLRRKRMCPICKCGIT